MIRSLFSDTNVKERKSLLVATRVRTTTFESYKRRDGKTVPRTSILVSDDTFVSEEIFIKPSTEPSEIKIEWKLISKDYKSDGVLTIFSTPIIENNREFIEIVDDHPTGG